MGPSRNTVVSTVSVTVEIDVRKMVVGNDVTSGRPHAVAVVVMVYVEATRLPSDSVQTICPVVVFAHVQEESGNDIKRQLQVHCP